MLLYLIEQIIDKAWNKISNRASTLCWDRDVASGSEGKNTLPILKGNVFKVLHVLLVNERQENKFNTKVFLFQSIGIRLYSNSYAL